MAKGKYQEWLTEEGLLQLGAWARDGLTDEQIANNIGVSRSTLDVWKKKYPDISDTLKKNKDVVDIEVENKLFKRAMGYSYTEDEYMVVEMEDEEYFDELEKHMKIFQYDNPEATDQDIAKERLTFSKYKKVLTKQKTKEVVPDTTAQIFWLKNRKPYEWRDKQVLEHDGSLGIHNPLSNLTEDELRRLANETDG
ncbi:helix-turn-helix domain-containing protein [Tetragenococcus halophilus]|uniref:Helix-turn-helix domain-containing protein n=1 Tax=Tetragenococcus halophilus (strain DSM 20338 / JCM 20259 / NCIMB 9735 / NBRC 12172) TaxID=945021 RepID=A0AAN1SFT0_TETHN|nr:helix-turn-helix domain-containing protein [Tetragenococcus halophilus]BAK94185.1 hypothetical protein TEH_08580 [Tetragenococcus halophilus NBRC 12172]GBD70766.1 putative uncharacterized protein [Tetragenococcus halophilus subsp. halophilus]